MRGGSREDEWMKVSDCCSFVAAENYRRGLKRLRRRRKSGH